MNDQDMKMLAEQARKIRLLALEGIYCAKSGHPGGSLSAADIISYLYFYKMNHSAETPNDPDRDRFVLSKGHAAPALYGALALAGYFPVESIKTLRKPDSFLQGHPNMRDVPGVDMSTGSLGQGVSAACGIAAAGKRTGRTYRTYCITGDGECQEGQVWEAAMFASHYKLSGLTLFLDYNNLQIDGKVSDVMDVAPLDKKYEAFGWHVQTIDGHDFAAIDAAVTAAESDERPSVIICNTIKGKGVSYMENAAGWHGKAPNAEEYAVAVRELGGEL